MKKDSRVLMVILVLFIVLEIIVLCCLVKRRHKPIKKNNAFIEQNKVAVPEPILLPQQFLVWESKNKIIRIYAVWDEERKEYVPRVEILLDDF